MLEFRESITFDCAINGSECQWLCYSLLTSSVQFHWIGLNWFGFSELSLVQISEQFYNFVIRFLRSHNEAQEISVGEKVIPVSLKKKNGNACVYVCVVREKVEKRTFQPKRILLRWRRKKKFFCRKYLAFSQRVPFAVEIAHQIARVISSSSIDCAFRIQAVPLTFEQM